MRECPFCASIKIDCINMETYDHDDFISQIYYMWCTVCDAQGPIGRDEEEAKELWNRR